MQFLNSREYQFSNSSGTIFIKMRIVFLVSRFYNKFFEVVFKIRNRCVAVAVFFFLCFIIVTKLDQNIITLLKAVCNGLPAILAQKSSGASSSPRPVVDGYGRIKKM